VAERGMAQVVAERDGLCEVLVETQSTGDGASYLRYFQGMSQPRDKVVALRRDEDLCLVLQPAESVGVQYPVAVPLEGRPYRARLFGTLPSLGSAATRSERRE
jgi:hypothetical protein